MALAGALALSASSAFGQAQDPSADYHEPAPERILAKPNFLDYVPEAGLRAAVPGHVKLHCILRPDAKLHDCSVFAETPTGYGYGAEARRAVERVRIQPLSVAGTPVAEEKIEVSLAWNFSDKPEAAKPNIEAVRAAIDPAGGPPLREPSYGHNRFGEGHPELGGPGSYWPERSERLGVSGVAVIQCQIAASGALSACSLLAEGPTTFGFGTAALKMAKEGWLRAAPLEGARDGDPGRLVIVFKNPHPRS